MEAGVKIGLLMNFNATNLKRGIKLFVLWILRALRVLRGEIILYLCESLGASLFLFSYLLEITGDLFPEGCDRVLLNGIP